jgi:hypothetical protein
MKETYVAVASLLAMFFVGMSVGIVSHRPDTVPIAIDTERFRGELMKDCFKNQIDIISNLNQDTRELTKRVDTQNQLLLETKTMLADSSQQEKTFRDTTIIALKKLKNDLPSKPKKIRHSLKELQGMKDSDDQATTR